MPITIQQEHYGGFTCFLGGLCLMFWGVSFWLWLIFGVGMTVGGFVIAIADTYDIDEKYGSDIGQQIRRKKILQCVFAVVLGFVIGWYLNS
jgi:ABC-type nickel/cobalt efflux system permease component RcnA